jgi:abhydrolase domain-containing protein 12
VPLYIWGHSLGSGVATKTASRLCQEGAIFNGLILESPFTNFVEAASNHPFSLPFRVMPWFSWVFIEAIKLNNIRFESDKHINGVTVPVIILHATDDGIVPYELGRKLYEVALRRTPDLKVDFVTFDGVHGYGHKHIHKSPQLVGIIRKFASEHNTRN